MKKMNLVLVAALALAALPVFADPVPAGSSAPSTAAGDHNSNLAQSTIGAAQDTAITTYIYAKLASHPSLSSFNLDISTTGGKVTLNGIVNDESQAKEIRQIAASTAGVKAVDASRIIVGQQDSSLYVKTSSNLPVEKPAPSATQATRSETAPAQTMAQAESAPVQPQAQTAPALSSEEPVAAQAQMKLSSADPLAGETAVEVKKPVKHAHLARNLPKHKHHLALKKHHPKRIQAALKKSRHLAHKKTSQQKMVAHLHHSQHKKTLAHAGHHSKKLEKHLATRSHHLAERIQTAHRISQKAGAEKISKHEVASIKKHEVASKKGSDESVDQMTNQFLKTALTANQPIPEE